MIGFSVSDIKRRGKFLIWEFKNKNTNIHALNHLGMTGVWHLYSDDKFNNFQSLQKEFKHYKVYFRLSDNLHLIYVNIRKFGKFIVMDIDQINNRPSIKKLGPDILELPFNVKLFMSKVKTRKKEIGKALLDSSVVAGCGNIYKCESLFRSKINPFRLCKDLSEKEIELLATKLSEVGQEALKNKGSTLKDFRHVDGYSGLMQNTFNVYGKRDKTCNICNEIILAEKQGDRTTFYCIKCQH